MRRLQTIAWSGSFGLCRTCLGFMQTSRPTIPRLAALRSNPQQPAVRRLRFDRSSCPPPTRRRNGPTPSKGRRSSPMPITNRNEVRALEAHPAARPVSSTRPPWRTGRVHAGGNRPKPTAPGKADHTSVAISSVLTPARPVRGPQCDQKRLLQHYLPLAEIVHRLSRLGSGCPNLERQSEFRL